MNKHVFLSKKTLVFGILILFLCMGSVSSIGNIVEDEISYKKTIKMISSKEEFFRNDKIVYAWREPQRGPCYFNLDDPGNVTQLGEIMGAQLLSGGTWTNDGRWFGVDLFSGSLYELFRDGDMYTLGGGGNELNGLAYNPITSKMYGAGSFCLYEIDINTEEHTYIGDYGAGPGMMMGIAFDFNGVLYGWDITYDNLWNINIETGQANIIGSLGIDIKYLGDGHFDFRSDTLYISTWTTKSQLYECNEDTGQCKLIGNFKGETLISAFAIPYDWPNHSPYRPTIDGSKVGIPGKEYCIKVCSVDPNGDHLFYYIDWGDGSYEDWFGPCISGINVKKCHTYPQITSLYEIRVKVKDIYGRESGWGKMYFFMLKNRNTFNLFFQRFMTNFPILNNCYPFYGLDGI